MSETDNAGRMVGRVSPWRQTAVITLVAAGVFAGIRTLPFSSSSLHYRDFHAGGKSFLEFCEPGSPQFAPVDRVRSPVELEVIPEQPPVSGAEIGCRLRLSTSTGKAVSADELLVVHTEKLHLLVVDSSLDDYQHVHPVPTRQPGEFHFSFRPARAGTYRMFADFTPRATGRALYASAKLDVASSAPVAPAQERPAAADDDQVAVEEFEFALVPGATPVRIFEATDLTLKIRRRDGTPLVLEEIMGAAAHMVAFDAGCTGFAHLHPLSTPVDPDQTAPTGIGVATTEARLKFALQLSDPGYYRIWAQVKIDGAEFFAPFDIQVEP